MKIEELSLDGVMLFESEDHKDQRGNFREWYRQSKMKAFLPREFEPRQANISISKLNVIRGIHFSRAKAGQAKLITCIQGSIQDIAVDLRPASPTFGEWVEADLSAESCRSIFIPDGYGHAFLSREPNTIITYLLSSEYSPNQEFALNPLDNAVGIKWKGESYILSDQDKFAKNLNEVKFQN
jgi:dTDP-4-dehydrorhamnose 3,5-epimerase